MVTVERIDLLANREGNRKALALGTEGRRCTYAGVTHSVARAQFRKYLKETEDFGTIELYSGEGICANIFIRTKGSQTPIAFLRIRTKESSNGQESQSL